MAIRKPRLVAPYASSGTQGLMSRTARHASVGLCGAAAGAALNGSKSRAGRGRPWRWRPRDGGRDGGRTLVRETVREWAPNGVRCDETDDERECVSGAGEPGRLLLSPRSTRGGGRSPRRSERLRREAPEACRPWVRRVSSSAFSESGSSRVRTLNGYAPADAVGCAGGVDGKEEAIGE